MFHGRNTGKKMNAMKIVEQAFDIINLMTDKNPIQILADADILCIEFLADGGISYTV